MDSITWFPTLMGMLVFSVKYNFIWSIDPFFFTVL